MAEYEVIHAAPSLVIPATVSMTTSSEVTATPQNIMELPRDIMNRILEFLLKAEDVVERTSLGTRKYDFHVAILRTCKDLNAAGISVFRLNHFIMLSAGYRDLFRLLDTHDIPNWVNKGHKLNKFKDYHIRMHIVSKDWIGPKVASVVLICAADIKALTIVFRGGVITSQPKFRLKIHIKSVSGTSLSVKHQHALLEPFKQLRGIQQKCSIVGADAVLATEVCARVASSVYWKRAQLLDCMEVIQFKLRLADEVLQGGNLKGANDLYEHAYITCNQSCAIVNAATTLGAWNIAKCLLTYHIYAEHQVAGTSLELVRLDKPPSSLQTLLSRECIPYPKSRASGEVLQLHRRGLAHLYLGDLFGARTAFASADKLDSKTKLGAIFRQQTSALKPAQAQLGPVRKLARDLCSLLPPLSKKTFSEHIVLHERDAIPSLEQELYDLEVLGYLGDTDLNIHEQLRGCSVVAGKVVNKSFDKRARDKALAPILARFAECDQQNIARPDHVVGVTIKLSETDTELHDIPEHLGHAAGNNIVGATGFAFQMAIGPDGQPGFTMPAQAANLGGPNHYTPSQIAAMLAQAVVGIANGTQTGGSGGGPASIS